MRSATQSIRACAVRRLSRLRLDTKTQNRLTRRRLEIVLHFSSPLAGGSGKATALFSLTRPFQINRHSHPGRGSRDILPRTATPSTPHRTRRDRVRLCPSRPAGRVSLRALHASADDVINL